MGVTNLDSLVLSGTLTADNIVPSAGGVATANLADAAVTPAKMSAPNAEETLNFFVAGVIAAGAKQAGAIVGHAGTITDVRAYCDTAPTGATLIADVNKNGTTLFTTQGARPTIAISGNASTTTAPAVTAVAAGDRITVDVDQVGSSVAGADLYVSITIKRNVVA